jgi:hypothetical protein
MYELALAGEQGVEEMLQVLPAVTEISFEPSDHRNFDKIWEMQRCRRGSPHIGVSLCYHLRMLRYKNQLSRSCLVRLFPTTVNPHWFYYHLGTSCCVVY